MPALNEMQRNKIDLLVQGGMSYDKALDKVMNDAAVAAAKKVIEQKKEPAEKTGIVEKTKMAVLGKRYKSKKEFKPTGRRG